MIFTCSSPSRFPHSPVPSFPLALAFLRATHCNLQSYQDVSATSTKLIVCKYCWLLVTSVDRPNSKVGRDVSRNRCLPTEPRPVSVQNPWRSACQCYEAWLSWVPTGHCASASSCKHSGQQRFYGKFNVLLMPWLLTSVSSFSVSENNIGLAWLLKEACQEDLNRQIWFKYSLVRQHNYL